VNDHNAIPCSILLEEIQRQIAEVLVDLATARRAPSPEKLRAIREKYGFQQAWYDEDSKPF
jgi:hypothetical protein